MTGFEPAASCSQSKRSTKLSHIRLYEIVRKGGEWKASALPVAILGALLGGGAPASLTDRGHSLGSLDSATGGGRLVPLLRYSVLSLAAERQRRSPIAATHSAPLTPPQAAVASFPKLSHIRLYRNERISSPRHIIHKTFPKCNQKIGERMR